jgi:hypothetical protein
MGAGQLGPRTITISYDLATGAKRLVSKWLARMTIRLEFLSQFARECALDVASFVEPPAQFDLADPLCYCGTWQ